MPTTTKPPIKRAFVGGRSPVASAVNVSVAPPRQTVTDHPQECCCPACVGLECLDRTRYFSGQLLTEADLNNEQSYWLAKSRLHNRFLHGWGAVCGMQVVCSECDGWVTVKPGYAIDPCGNDIIVCSDCAFNVIKAIQACCTPSKQTGNCAPLRSTPPANCQGTTQTWCITIEYQEQPSRLVTPLKQASPKRSKCSCGGTKGSCGCGCGCDCGGHGNGNGSSSSSNGCSCNSTATQSPSVPAGACEPTRINEGFRLCVVPAPTTLENPKGSLPGTAAYQIEQCVQGIRQLMQQAPAVGSNVPNGITDLNLAYTAVCNYLATVSNYFASSSVEHCLILDNLSQILVPAPPAQSTSGYLDQLGLIVDQLKALVTDSALDCICMALIPPCPPDPCDDRVCLACVTVRDGKIIDICHFGCRHQVVTFHTLYYWLSVFGFDRILLLLKRYLELICCGDRGIRGVLGANVYQRENLTSAGFSNPGMVNQLFSMFVAQKLGSTFVNAMTPNSQTVDLRPLVGLDTEHVLRSLESYKISNQNITPIKVDSDPSWNDDAVAAGAQFTPSAFSTSDNLTMYTKGKTVVGFDVTDPVSVLKSQVQQLQQQVSQLTGAGHGVSPAHGPTPKGGPQKKRI
jgi:hypothetical protein